MNLREILNKAESTIISAKSYNANNNMAIVRNQLWNLKTFLDNELPAELTTEQPPVGNVQPAAGNVQPTEQPTEDVPESEKDTVDLPAKPATDQAESPNEPAPGEIILTAAQRKFIKDRSESEPAPGSIKPFELPEKDGGQGIVSEPTESKGQDGSGETSKPDKSQTRDGSGIS